MATKTLTPLNNVGLPMFPNGTLVNCVNPINGAIVDQATVTGGNVTFTALADNTEYEVNAVVSGESRHFEFFSDPVAPVGLTTGLVKDWTANEPIKLNELRRIPDGTLARWALPDGTSGAVFTAANWTPIAGGIFLPIGDRAVADSYNQATDLTLATVTPMALDAASGISGGITTTAVNAIADPGGIVRPLGAHLAVAGTFPDNAYVKPDSQTGGFGQQPYSEAFLTDQLTFEYSVKEASAARSRLRVNGKIATNWLAVATNGGLNQPYSVTLAGPAGVKRVEIEYGGSTLAGRKTFPPTATVTPVDKPLFRGVFFGDSFAEPTNANGADGLGAVMLRDAGIEFDSQSGAGGSGYVQAGGSGTLKTFVQRGTDIDNFGPWDLITVMDIDSGTAAATLGTAATQFWNERRAANPNAVLVAFGMILKSATLDTQQDLAVKAAVEAVGGTFVSMAGAIADSYFHADGTHMADAAANIYAGHIMYNRLRTALRAKGIELAARQSATEGNLAAHSASKAVHGFADISTLSSLRQPDVQVFTANGTWNKPANAKAVEIICQGGGGGGGSGRVSASGTAAAGGGGGGGGGRAIAKFAASQLPASVAITIGGFGAGGAAQATNSTNGNNGAAGGGTSFSTFLTGAGGQGGGGGTTASGAAGLGQGGGAAGAAGGIGAGAIGATSSFSAGNGGGSGGGLATTPANLAGGAGGAPSVTSRVVQGSGGSAGGGAGGAATSDADTTLPLGGAGGGGGGSAITGAGGVGGAGGNYGAGGGGGGAALDAQAGSGAGGGGKPGICVVISW